MTGDEARDPEGGGDLKKGEEQHEEEEDERRRLLWPKVGRRMLSTEKGRLADFRLCCWLELGLGRKGWNRVGATTGE